MKKKLFKLSVLNVLLCLSGYCYSQKQEGKQGDQNKDIVFVNTLKIQKKIAKKGYVNIDMLMKLGDTYYFNGKLKEANEWYKQLLEEKYKDNKALPSEYYYRYAQSLKSIGEYEKSNLIMEKFAELEEKDSRTILFKASKEHYLKEIDKRSNRYVLRNAGFNSSYSDYGGMVLGNKIVYTSARNTEFVSKNKLHEWTNESFTNLYSTVLNKDGSFEEPERFAAELELDSKQNESTPVFTSDGKTMYFTRNTLKKNSKNISSLKIYKASLSDKGKWENIEEVVFNSERFNTAHPALTPDDKWIYFSSDREGTIGQTDLFRVPIYPMGNFGEVENLGKSINTEGRETFPFISKDYILFFSSDGYPGLGGLDVYGVKINVDGTFGQVTNMGAPINSNSDDFAFYIDSEIEKGMVSSNRENGKGSDDIYFFSRKECKQTLEGKVFDSETKSLLNQVKLSFYDNYYNPIIEAFNNEQGDYRFEGLLCNNRYRIKAELEEYQTAEVVVEINNQQDKVYRKNIFLEKVEKSITKEDDLFKKLNLNPIYFDFDRSIISDKSAIELMKIVEVLNHYPTMKIDVRAHTDSRGNDYYNLKLSNQRAKSTIKWIIDHGIDPQRLSGVGYGENQLLNQCSKGVPCTIEEHQLNRRSEFIITEL